MSELFLMYTVTLAFICVFVALLLVYRYFLGSRLLQAEKKLRAALNRVPQEYRDIIEKPSSVVTKGIGDIGIDGIMEELGIDPKLLNNPLVKGLIDKYAPKLLDRLAEKGNEQEGTGNNLL